MFFIFFHIVCLYATVSVFHLSYRFPAHSIVNKNTKKTSWTLRQVHGAFFASYTRQIKIITLKNFMTAKFYKLCSSVFLNYVRLSSVLAKSEECGWHLDGRYRTQLRSFEQSDKLYRSVLSILPGADRCNWLCKMVSTNHNHYWSILLILGLILSTSCVNYKTSIDSGAHKSSTYLLRLHYTHLLFHMLLYK